MNPHYPHVAVRAGHRCEYCRAPEAIFNVPFEVEHIVPRHRGGSDTEENLALACRSCNLFKSDAVSAIDEVSKTKVQMFDPRRQLWDEHFQIDVSTLMVLGVTPTGRATVAKLKLNVEIAVAARMQWRRLGLFPP